MVGWIGGTGKGTAGKPSAPPVPARALFQMLDHGLAQVVVISLENWDQFGRHILKRLDFLLLTI